jgi:hypothetical protein
MCHTAELPYLKGTTKATLCLALQLAGLAFPPTLKEQCINLEEQGTRWQWKETLNIYRLLIFYIKFCKNTMIA